MSDSTYKIILQYRKVLHKLAGPRLVQLVFFSLIGTALEGFGIALFLPLLNVSGVSGGGSDRVSRAVNWAFGSLGIPMSLGPLLGLMLAVAIVKGLVEFQKDCFLVRLRADVIDDLRARTVRLFSRIRYNYYMKKESGYFLHFLSTEVPKISDAFYHYGAVISQLVTVAMLLGFSFLLNWTFTFFAILLGGVIGFFLKSYSVRSKVYSRENSELGAKLSGLSVQSVHNFKYLVSTHAFEKLIKRILKIGTDVKNLSYWLGAVNSFVRIISEPVAVAVMVLLIYLEVQVFGKSLVSLMVSMLIFYRCIRMVTGFQSIWQNFSAVAGAIDYVYEGYDEMEKNAENVSGSVSNFKIGEIKFSNVAFAYGPNRLFESLNLRIGLNSTAAIVGASGAGKSTIVDLLTGILEPSSGEITVGNNKLSVIDKDRWRSMLGYVTQDCAIFDDTIANNISLWDESVDNEEKLQRLKRAAKDAHILSFVEGLPDGFETKIGDRGVRLSGGQRQRLAIARELYKSPDLLILDEATSALDGESESEIKDSLARLKGKMTIIVIAHRMSTVRNADNIYVLDGGKVAEEGNFDTLSSDRNSIFNRLTAGEKL